MGTQDCEFFFLLLNLNTIPTNSVSGQFGHIRQVKTISAQRSSSKYKN